MPSVDSEDLLRVHSDRLGGNRFEAALRHTPDFNQYRLTPAFFKCQARFNDLRGTAVGWPRSSDRQSDFP